MRKTRVEILNETLQYYSEDTSRRALQYDPKVGDVFCAYKTEDGKMCAVGRCIDEESGFDFTRKASVTSFFPSDYTKLFKEDYKGKNKGFWHLLQKFHDDNKNWSDKGISEAGIKEYDRLTSKFQKRDDEDKNNSIQNKLGA